MNVKDAYRLKILHSDVINGYTSFYSPVLKQKIYIKHIDNFISSETDSIYQQFFNRALENGLSTEAEVLEKLKESGEWTSKHEKELYENKDYLDRLKVTKSKQYLLADIERLKYQIAGAEKAIKDLEEKKNNLIGATAEKYANKRMNDYFVRLSYYQDPKLSQELFSQEDFDELDPEQIHEMFKFFNEYLTYFTPLNLKKISLLPAYLNYFFLCDGNPYVFFGKPVVNLTYYQVETFSNAKYFKHIMEESENSVSNELMQDPDKLIEWFEANKNVKKVLDKYENVDNMNVSLVGATKKDYENLGLSTTAKSINLAAEAAKRGGSIGMEELLRLQAL